MDLTDETAPSDLRKPLYARFEALNIGWRTVNHPAVFTVEESADLKAHLHGGHSKNLFMKDKAGVLTLAIAYAQTIVDLKALGKALGAKARLSFGKPELMQEVLGVAPGSVTPFSLLNDTGGRITNVVLDTALLAHDPVWFHPLENTGSTAVSPDDLKAFIASCGHQVQVMDLTAPPLPS